MVQAVWLGSVARMHHSSGCMVGGQLLDQGILGCIMVQAVGGGLLLDQGLLGCNGSGCMVGGQLFGCIMVQLYGRGSVLLVLYETKMNWI